MAIIQGSLTSAFVDSGVYVSVVLNDEPATRSDNEDKPRPRLLQNTTLVKSGKYIGNAVICQSGSHIAFDIWTEKGIAGFVPRITTQQEVITDDLYAITKKRYGHSGCRINRYADKPKTIQVSDFGHYEKAEGFRRSNVMVSVREVTSFVSHGVRYPRSGVEADVHPGSLDHGRDTGHGFAKASGAVTFGDELGALQLQVFVLDSAKAVRDFAVELSAAGVEDW